MALATGSRHDPPLLCRWWR